MSFHLEFVLGKGFVLPEGCDSVGVLRSPYVGSEGKTSKENLAGTKLEFWTKKFNSSTTVYGTNGNDKMWQDRLLIITEKRIFIVTEKATVNMGGKNQEAPQSSLGNNDGQANSGCGSSMEIVDSIPMEEIVSVTLDMESHPGTWSHDTMDGLRLSSSNLQEIKGNLKEVEHNLRQSRPSLDMKRGRTSRSFEMKRGKSSTSGIVEPKEPCEPILRILTKPGEFNSGEPYYFLLPKQDCHCVDTEARTMPLHTRDDADAIASRLASLAARRRTEHARENRFHSLQKNLCRAWNSIAFNLLVLVLIMSNFAFTVMQLENKDPDMQRFYENVDFSYTIIFAVGIFSPLSSHTNPHSPRVLQEPGLVAAQATNDRRVVWADGIGLRGGRAGLQLSRTRLLAFHERLDPPS